MDKTLKSKAVKIQGRDYILVSDRVLFFNDNFPNGSITSELLSRPEDTMIVVKATVTPDLKNPERYFTGHAQEVIGSNYITKTSALEVAETSAVGRALGLMGIGVIESIASADEIVKATNRTTQLDPYASRKTCPTCKKAHNGPWPKCLDCFRAGKSATGASKSPLERAVVSAEAFLEEPPLPNEPF